MPPQDNHDQNTNVNPTPNLNGDSPAAPAEPVQDVTSSQPVAPSFGAPTPPADSSATQPDFSAVSTPVESATPTEPPVTPEVSTTPSQPTAPLGDVSAPSEPAVPSEPATPEAPTNDDQNNKPFVSQ